MLLLDCGNTALKCLFNEELEVFLIRAPNFKHALSQYIKTIPSSTDVVLSSVSDKDTLKTLTTVINQHFTKPTTMAVSEAYYGDLKNAYIDAKKLGVDRWLAMLATQNMMPNRIIIDAGSWIKMDVILAHGQHLGGAIISHSKQKEDELFKRFSLKQPKDINSKVLFGKDTQQCVCLSFGQYHLEAVNQLLTRWLDDLQSPCQIIVSGGDAKKVIASIKSIKPSLQKYILDIQQIEILVLLGLSTRYAP